ncbi:flagellar hook assembly protein FlgD [Rhizobium sp. SSA_523]|uniref:flagellar hook assembly protein FlgD n=1 Tax=Rhizobium sp. SSA_523 TaxID=2952477 RepID=UPI002091313D|nr:flagellar hook assembly protein FlgD [Rhizobium sp. SSA_523]MCO5733039.1 flagellar hook assembly protein FlgD [Rhizobium sp. SSA_523]WKC23919.1 flagellar hook assembly protein FlgD [Rhizobium sp. SSA_523]
MAVGSVSSTTATTNPWANAAATTSDQNKASVNYNSFLKLLIAQMKNQDPTSPMDASEQISQLASFSQVEQTIQTNTHLKSMLQAEALTRAADMVGKYIMSADQTTTGKIKEMQVYTDGVIALTEDDKKVLLQAGVTVSDNVITAKAKTTDGTSNTK